MAIKEIEYNGLKYSLSYEIIGQNGVKNILILHGWGANKELMKSAFSKYLNQFNCVYLDLPGFGLSSAVLSSNFDLPIPSDVCFAGEIGLSGEVRPVAQTDRRVIEAARLGFRKIYVSTFSSLEGLGGQADGIEVIRITDVPSLCRSLFKG